MSLLTTATRKKYFKELGLGEYNKTNIKKFQKRFMARESDWDGVYGQNTDNLLRHVYNCSKVKNFGPTEFKCGCNGRYCTGYPTYMKQIELANLQTIRTHYDKPMTITSGLRCKQYNNSLSGSISNSKHLTGYAADFYMLGVTDSLANREKAVKYIKTLPNHGYTYGNGIDSNGTALSASYMGNALHHDTTAVATTTKATTTGNASKIIAKAKELAWPSGTSSSVYKYKGGKPRPAYKEALNKVYPNRGSWGAPPRAGASCDVFVGTVLRSTGIEPNYPRGLAEQFKYTPKTLKRLVYKNKKISSVAKAGDVIMYTKTKKQGGGAHTCILGNGVVYDANYKSTYGRTRSTAILNKTVPKIVILRQK